MAVDLDAIKREIAEYQEKAAKAQESLVRAEAQMEIELKRLKEFGAQTIQEAKEMMVRIDQKLVTMEQELMSRLDEVREKIDEKLTGMLH
jgi:hypothetical protein